MNNLPDNVTEVFNDGTQAYYKVKMNFNDLFKDMNKENNTDIEDNAFVTLTLKQYNSILTRLNQLEETVKKLNQEAYNAGYNDGYEEGIDLD